MRQKWIWLLCLCIGWAPLHAQAEEAHRPNDPFFDRQSYHLTTKVSEAWNKERENQEIVIAVLDTGVDHNHPDLKENLVPGFNLLQPGKPPTDDNGHGTATAGILAAEGNNERGIAGVLWKAKVMPIKVLDGQGNGDARRVAQGIRLAVDQGARIILSSLGDPIYSEEMEQAVRYAEEKGVLIVAATGNNSNRVIYPAAFPTVLSVGALDHNLRVLPYSNRGPEMDLVAPGLELYSTNKGGGYAVTSGTSTAAPQVAGIAALLLKSNPELTPMQVRMILRGSAQDLGTKGWDADTGYGLMDAQRALEQARNLDADIYEPNHELGMAAPLPIITRTQAFLGAGDDADWYRLDVPYNGDVIIRIQTSEKNGFLTELYRRNSEKIVSANTYLKAKVDKGTVYLKLSNPGSKTRFAYQLDIDFTIAEDRHGSTRERAAELPAGNDGKVIGNFHQRNDADWFTSAYSWPGRLDLRVTTDSLRMDPVLTIEYEGKWKKVIDDGSANNKQEESWSSAISPGRYYYQLKDYYGNAVNGEYELTVRYTPSPSSYFADITAHWARNEIERLAARKVIAGFPDGSFRPDRTMSRAEAAVMIQRVMKWPAPEELKSFRDIRPGHWAYPAFMALVKHGVITPASDQALLPDKPLTRAELAVMLYRAKYGTQVPKESREKLPFSDLPREHWAHPYVLAMWKAKHLNGLDKNRFGPDQPATRAEFAVLLHRMWP